MNRYKVSLQRKGEDYPAYHIEAEGWSEESAIFEAKRFLAENGWWPNCLSTSERIECLTAVEITLIDTDNCQYYVNMDKIGNGRNTVPSLCMAYSQSKRADDKHWANYPCCEDKNCPLKHPELLNDNGVTATL